MYTPLASNQIVLGSRLASPDRVVLNVILAGPGIKAAAPAVASVGEGIVRANKVSDVVVPPPPAPNVRRLPSVAVVGIEPSEILAWGIYYV